MSRHKSQNKASLSRSWYKDHSHTYNSPFFTWVVYKWFNSTSIGNYVPTQVPFSEQFRHCMVLTNAIATRKRRSRLSIVAASTDSSLEAFSHNPTDGSFAALPGQATALPIIWTTGSSRTKVDYCRDNYFISRVKQLWYTRWDVSLTAVCWWC